MSLPPFDYREPKSIRETCGLLRDAGETAVIIAGGTDLLPALKNRLKGPALLVGLNRIPSLKTIRYTDAEGLTIGAMVSLRHLASHAVVRAQYPILAVAAQSMGTVQLQAMGTLGGNICQDACCVYYGRSSMSRQALGPCIKSGGFVCHAVRGSKSCWATYCGDMAPALLSLRATVTVADVERERSIPLKEIFSGKGEKPQSLGPSQIVTAVQVPSANRCRTGGTYLKMRMRKAIDYPLIGVAASVSLDRPDSTDADVVVGLTAVEKEPILVKSSATVKSREDLVAIAKELSESAFNLAHPIANMYGYSPRYRREMVRSYVQKAIHESYSIALTAGGKG